MVYQTYGLTAAEHRDAPHDIIGIRPVLQLLQGITIYNSEILHLQPDNGIQCIHHIAVCLLQCMIGSKITALGKDCPSNAMELYGS